MPRIALAQIDSVAGNLSVNAAQHEQWVERAADAGAELVIFPELSLTGYEPSYAQKVAIQLSDRQLDGLQQQADSRDITIAAGCPTQGEAGICISLVILQPGRPRSLYLKEFLYKDEIPFFAPRHGSLEHSVEEIGNTALAICYEVSVPEHAARAARSGRDAYLASVAKTAEGMEKSMTRFRQISREFNMVTLVANSVGQHDRWQTGGRSAAWNRNGDLIAQLDATEESLLIVDTDSETLV